MRMESAGTIEPAGPSSHPTPVRWNIVSAGDGRTPAPLNIVGEETLVKVSSEDSDATLAFFHLVAHPCQGRRATCTRARTNSSMFSRESSFSSSMENGVPWAQAIRCTSAVASSTRIRTSPPRTLGFSSPRRRVCSAISSSNCRLRRHRAPCPLLISSTLSQRSTA